MGQGALTFDLEDPHDAEHFRAACAGHDLATAVLVCVRGLQNDAKRAANDPEKKPWVEGICHALHQIELALDRHSVPDLEELTS
jgi:hypothetical protein